MKSSESTQRRLRHAFRELVFERLERREVFSAGSLDTTFDGDGKVTTDIGSSTDIAYSVAIQSDGRIVVAGFNLRVGNNDFALMRYNSNGSLDTTFDGDGRVTTAVGNGDDIGRSVAIQSDGKIILAGHVYNGSDHDFALTRYHSNGSLDTTFDVDGKVITTVGSFDDLAFGVAIQSDGKIVVAGNSYNGSKNDFALTRYNPNGSLDTTFDGDGKVTTAVGSGDDFARSLAIQSDGKIVVAGYSYNGRNYDFALTRYNPNGSLDTTFDGDGKVTTAVGSFDDLARSVAIQSDGKIVVAGNSQNSSNYDFALARYNSNGSLDTTFDGDGKVMTAVGSSDDFARSLAIQGDGKIVVAGNSQNGSNHDFALTRYQSNGSLDNTLDGDGKVMTGVGSADDFAMGVAIQNDGKIVVAGYTLHITYDFALVRYLGDNQPPSDIHLSSTTIAENAGENATVGSFTSTDPDAGNAFTYTLVAGAGDTDNAAFNISGATLRAAHSFDFETKSSYTIRVRSSDPGGLFTEKAFIITVANINEAPVLTRSQAALSGNVLSTLTNTGTWWDPEGDVVTLSASLGTATKNANGTWDWSLVPSRLYSNQIVTINGIDDKGLASQLKFTIDALVAVVDSKVYYKGSSFAGSGVNAALDTSKAIAKSGAVAQELTFENLINTSRGINGLVMDVAGLAAANLIASDFVFRMSPTGAFSEATNPPSSWVAAPAPTLIHVTAGTSTTPARVRLEWADNAIENRWLQIKVLANANTGLLAPQVYYIGHLQGETNGWIEGGTFRVRGTDISPMVSAIDPSLQVPVTHLLDLNKDGRIRGTDASPAVAAIGQLLTRITIPAYGSGDEGEGGSGPRNLAITVGAPAVDLPRIVSRSVLSVSEVAAIRARLTDAVFNMPAPADFYLDGAPAVPASPHLSKANAETAWHDDNRTLSLEEYLRRVGRRSHPPKQAHPLEKGSDPTLVP